MSSETIPPALMPPTPPGPVDPGDPTQVPPEALPDLEQFQIEDGKPVDNIFTEKQQRLLGRTLYVSWPGPGEGRPFQVFTDVGLFYAVGHPPLSPDVMLSLDIVPGQDMTKKENRSYFVWLRRKPPDVVIEIVSDRRGGETGYKRNEYARAGVSYYVVFDPKDELGEGVLRCWHLLAGQYEPLPGPFRFSRVGLGLALWDGTYEDLPSRWLRWCDRDGVPLPTDEELIAQARQRATQAEERAKQAEERAEDERRRREKLEARLRELGGEP